MSAKFIIPYGNRFLFEGAYSISYIVFYELRAAIGGTTAPEATTVDTLGGATDIGKNILKARDAAAVRTLLNVAEKPAA